MSTTETGRQGGIALQRASGLILLNDTAKGRGVFASSPIPKGTVLEVSPVLILPLQEVEQHTSQTILNHYTYYWPSPDGKGPQTQAIALGLGSMFNHSRLKQNVIWNRDVTAGTITYTAHRNILVGEELCISYGNARLWFDDADENELEGKGDEEGVQTKDEMEKSGLHAIFMVSSNGDTSDDGRS